MRNRSNAAVWFAVMLLLTVSCKRDPQKLKAAYVASGDTYVAARNYADAIIQYRNAVVADPAFGEARFKLAEAYERTGDLKNALREYVRAADLMPNDVLAQTRAANGLLSIGQYPEARARAIAALSRDPKNVNALIIMGSAMAGMKDLDGAITTVGQAVDADPQAILAYTNLGSLEMAKGDAAAAETAFKRATEIDPKSETARLELANYYWASKKLPDAERELKSAAQANPKSVLANRALAVFYSTTGQVAKAEEYLRAYASLSDDVTPKIILADFYVIRNQTSQAAAVLEPLVKTSKGFVPAKIRLAAIDFGAGRRPQAYQTLDEVLKREPTNEAAMLEKGRFLLADRKAKEALAQANLIVAQNATSPGGQYLKGMALKAVGSTEEAASAFQQTLKLSPDSLAPLLQLAELNLALGNPTATAQYASDVIRKQPLSGEAHLFLATALVRLGNLPRAEPEVLGLLKGSLKSVDVMVLAGDFYSAKSDLKQARQSYEKALTLEQGSIAALTGLTRIDLTEKKPQAARSRLEAQLAKHPDDEKLLILAGSAFMDLADPQKSEATFRHLLQVNPASLQAYGALAGIYVSQHRLDDARHEYEEIARRNPTAAPAALTMVGTILSLQGQNDEARKRYQQALALDPTMPIAANNLAWDYAETGGNLDVALTLVQTAKSKLPTEGTVSDTLGWVYYKKGLASLAVTSLEEAAKQSPRDPSIRYRLGLAYRKSGDQTKARGSFEQALKLNPQFKEAEDAKRELAALKG